MATGILSTALSLAGFAVPSTALLAAAAAGLVVLTGLSITRIRRFRHDIAADLVDPGCAFGFFTIVAGLDVVAAGFAAAGQAWPGAVVAALSVPIWIALNYGIPAGLFLRTTLRATPLRLDGSWLLWVVGTQALAIVTTSDTTMNNAVASVAVALWGVGVILYLIITILIVHQLVSTRNLPDTFAPTYWILMGATAITVLAASHILHLPHALPIVMITDVAISGTGFLFWAVGTWWIPFLVIFGIWRHVVHRVPLRYSTALWSIVFPLGMYSAASMDFGAITGMPLLVDVGRVMTALAALAWIAVASAGCSAAIYTLRGGTRRGVPPTETTR